MKYSRRFSFFVALFIHAGAVQAQYTDTVQVTPFVHDTVPQLLLQWKPVAEKTSKTFRPYIVPAAFVVYGFLSMHTDPLQDINEHFKEEIFTERQPRKTSVDNYLQFAPAITVYALNAVGMHGANNFRDRTIIYGISNLIMGTTVYAVKNITKEPRPDGADDPSFPSGHTATAFVAAEFLRQEYKNISLWYGIAGYAAAAATGYLRLQNNKHWMGDIIAGAGVGIISTKLAYAMYPAIKRAFFKDREVSTIVMPSYQQGSLGLSLVKQF